MDRDAELRRQHEEYLRSGYDGHNRKPIAATVGQLKVRSRRRLWNRRLADWVQEGAVPQRHRLAK